MCVYKKVNLPYVRNSWMDNFANSKKMEIILDQREYHINYYARTYQLSQISAIIYFEVGYPGITHNLGSQE